MIEWRTHDSHEKRTFEIFDGSLVLSNIVKRYQVSDLLWENARFWSVF